MIIHTKDRDCKNQRIYHINIANIRDKESNFPVCFAFCSFMYLKCTNFCWSYQFLQTGHPADKKHTTNNYFCVTECHTDSLTVAQTELHIFGAVMNHPDNAVFFLFQATLPSMKG